MMMLTKIARKLTKLRLQPIHVYCLHHVCLNFDAASMHECDWTHIVKFRNWILAMRHNGVKFISLSDAYRHISKDKVRNGKYAVLTFDDGYASLKEVLPWLEKQGIPATLFINGKYLDGISYRKTSKELYLTKEELFAMTSPLIEIGSHGWEHIDATKQTETEFMESVTKNIQLLSQHPRYIPFHAYTYGRYIEGYNDALKYINLTPVLIDGGKNYNDVRFIHRELLGI